jgi:iron complex transport system ATP-binding protein
MIRFEKVQIGYETPLVEVDLKDISKGNLAALIGENGSGKSTFLKTLAGIYRPIHGRILLAEQDTNQLTRKELAKIIAFVPSKFPETDFLKVHEFVALGRTPYLSNFGTLSELDRQIVEQSITQVNLGHLANKYTHQLSDGERQLCSIARALAQQTPVLLLDEPTNFLDYRNKRRLLSLLQQLCKETNITILFSTHDIEVVIAHEISLIGIDTNRPLRKLSNVQKPNDLNEIVHHFYQ